MNGMTTVDDSNNACRGMGGPEGWGGAERVEDP